MKSAPRLAKGDVATGATDVAEEAGVADTNARAEAAGGGRGYESDGSLTRAVQAVDANNKEAINKMLAEANDKKIPETASSVASSVTTGSPNKGGKAGVQFQV